MFRISRASDYTVPFGKAASQSEGPATVSIITFGAIVHPMKLPPASSSAKESVEIIDLRSLLPTIGDAIAATVRQESPRHRGL